MNLPDSPPPHGRLARLIASWVECVCCIPWLVLAFCGLSVVASLGYSYTHLQYQTQRNDLISAEKECQKRWQKYLDAFGDDDDFVLVIRGENRERMAAASDAVAALLKAQPRAFDRVFHRVDLRSLYSRSLLYADDDQLRQVERRLDQMQPLLGTFGEIGWRSLSLHALIAQAKLARTSTKPTPADQDLLRLLPILIDSATKTVQNPADYRNPWSLYGSHDQTRPLREPQYFFTPDSKLCLVLARPVKESESFTPVRRASQKAREILAEVRTRFPELQFGLTGLPVLETDEMAASEEDSTFASWLAVVGVAVLYFVVYRGFRYPFLTVVTVLLGSVWALGFATLTVGHLNILSATFAVMIIGLGDYGVLWVSRFDEYRRCGFAFETALRETSLHAGPSIVTAAITTSLAFFATMLADFKAVAELGWIAGCGVLFCAVACLTLLPAMQTVWERRRGTLAAPAREFGESRAFLPVLSRRPRTVLLVGLAIVFVCGLFSGRVYYDANLLHMQANGLDSVNWEHELIEHAAGATWDVMSLAKNRDEALQLKRRYEALPSVGRVVEAASLIPERATEKQPLVASIHKKLSRLPKQLGDPPPTDVAALTDDLTHLAGVETTRLRTLLQEPQAAERLRVFDRKLRDDLLADLQALHAMSQPGNITVNDLPAEFRERYIGSNGEFLVRAFASQSLWEIDSLETFTQAGTTVDPVATGKSYRTLEGLRQMRSGFERAGMLALGVIITVLWLDFGSARAVLLGLFPLLVGVLATLGILGLTGIPLNPANLIALPLIVGVGVDNGLHVLHDYSDRIPGKLYVLSAATGRGITVAALTTVLGFGTLILARHRGMASLGLVLTLGVTFCMIASLVLLPALLRWLDARAMKRPHSKLSKFPLRSSRVTR